MKLEREKDIAAFKGKNWREKCGLRYKAEDRDPWILRLKLLKYFFVFVPMLALVNHLFPHYSFLAMMTVIIIVGLPIDMALYALFIVPRIRKALDANTQPTA